MKVGVIGAGAWGSALAISAARAGSDVTIISRKSNIAADINNNRLNSEYLGSIQIPDKVTASTNINDISDSNCLLLVMPAQAIRASCQELNTAATIEKNTPLVICAKGIEQNSLALTSDIVAEYFPHNPIAIISGPNFADEIAKALPACATIACHDKIAADKIIQLLGSKMFRLYYSDDVIGAQIGGATKNVLAIACGIAIGMGLGENARAALVTRGIFEISRLCNKMGGRPETLLGLSGIGDIMLTCGSEKSRNMSLGIAISHGKNLTEILQSGKTVEGVETAKSVDMLAQKLNIEMPITQAVKAILHDGVNVKETVGMLLQRKLVAEGW